MRNFSILLSAIALQLSQNETLISCQALKVISSKMTIWVLSDWWTVRRWFDRPAGSCLVQCVTTLWREFIDILHDPENWHKIRRKLNKFVPQPPHFRAPSKMHCRGRIFIHLFFTKCPRLNTHIVTLLAWIIQDLCTKTSFRLFTSYYDN